MKSIVRILSLVAVFGFAQGAVAAVTDVDSSAAASTCVTNSKGVAISEIEANTALTDKFKGFGGVRGFLGTWRYEDKGTVKFYSNSAGRLSIYYSAPFNEDTVRISKICVTSGGVRMAGSVDGEPFTVSVGFTGRSSAVNISLKGGEVYRFTR